MKKPRLLVLGASFPTYEHELKEALSNNMRCLISNVEVTGSTATPYSVDSLLLWAILGKSTRDDRLLQGVQRGCDLYVGVSTPVKEYKGRRTIDGRFDSYQLGERGLLLAEEHGIPAIILESYNERFVRRFVLDHA